MQFVASFYQHMVVQRRVCCFLPLSFTFPLLFLRVSNGFLFHLASWSLYHVVVKRNFQIKVTSITFSLVYFIIRSKNFCFMAWCWSYRPICVIHWLDSIVSCVVLEDRHVYKRWGWQREIFLSLALSLSFVFCCKSGLQQLITTCFMLANMGYRWEVGFFMGSSMISPGPGVILWVVFGISISYSLIDRFTFMLIELHPGIHSKIFPLLVVMTNESNDTYYFWL